MNYRRIWRTIALLLPFIHLPLQAQWVQLPGPFGGLPQDFLVQGSSLYVATDGDGVYSSVDSGATWTPSSAGLVQQRVRSLAALGADLIAGTTFGAYKSTNGGELWTGRSIYISLVSGGRGYAWARHNRVRRNVDRRLPEHRRVRPGIPRIPGWPPGTCDALRPAATRSLREQSRGCTTPPPAEPPGSPIRQGWATMRSAALRHRPDTSLRERRTGVFSAPQTRFDLGVVPARNQPPQHLRPQCLRRRTLRRHIWRRGVSEHE